MDRRGILAFVVLLGALFFWLNESSAQAEGAGTPVCRSETSGR